MLQPVRRTQVHIIVSTDRGRARRVIGQRAHACKGLLVIGMHGTLAQDKVDPEPPRPHAASAELTCPLVYQQPQSDYGHGHGVDTSRFEVGANSTTGCPSVRSN